MSHSREGVHTGYFVLSVFICFLKAAILGEVSGEDLRGIFIISSSVSFNMLMHQNEHIGSESWSLLIGWC